MIQLSIFPRWSFLAGRYFAQTVALCYANASREIYVWQNLSIKYSQVTSLVALVARRVYYAFVVINNIIPRKILRCLAGIAFLFFSANATQLV